MADIGEAFAHDHRRLEQALKQSVDEAEAGNWERAQAVFAAFRDGIERHMNVEEQLLFPVIESGTGMPLIAILRKGHRDLRSFLDEFGDALEVRDSEEYGRIAKSIMALLSRHDEKEETELYPAAQKRLGLAATNAVTKLSG